MRHALHQTLHSPPWRRRRNSVLHKDTAAGARVNNADAVLNNANIRGNRLSPLSARRAQPHTQQRPSHLPTPSPSLRSGFWFKARTPAGPSTRVKEKIERDEGRAQKVTWHFHNGASRFERFLGGRQRHFMMCNKLLNISLLNFKTAPKCIPSLG